jgi:putative alpha-1,2-mannosidase
MVPKDRNGRASNRFNPVEWGNGFTEGNSWHHSFPPYAVSCAADPTSSKIKGFDCNGGLISLHGSKEKLLEKLHQLVNAESNFQAGSYGQEIHEMTEMRAFAMGQYGHNNQPVHHILFLFSLLGDHESTQRYVRYVLDRAYGEDFYAGDEDNGEQGAWFVLAALGLYPVTPGLPSYVLSSPIFPHVRISRSDDVGDSNRHLDIFALGTSKENIFYDKVEVNNHGLDGLVDDEELFGVRSNGMLVFTMKTQSIDHSLDMSGFDRLHKMSTNDLEMGDKNHQEVKEVLPQQTVKSESDIEKLQEKIHVLEGEMFILRSILFT